MRCSAFGGTPFQWPWAPVISRATAASTKPIASALFMGASVDGLATSISSSNRRMTTRSRPLPWLAYAAFWLGVGLFFSLAEVQHYVRGGGRHPWEPFLWELSGSVTAGLLALAVYRLNDVLLARRVRMPARIAAYLAGLVAFSAAHSTLMYGTRYAVYALVGLHYEPGSLDSVLGYESAKDVVTYTLVLGLSMGWRSFRREQRQAAEVERLNAHLAEARLARLQEQVQPHFLFNTLNLISSVMHEDVERADRILAELADLLRQSISAANVAEHTLAQEMRWVEPFLSIMRQRFGERLRSRIAISEAAAGRAPRRHRPGKRAFASRDLVRRRRGRGAAARGRPHARARHAARAREGERMNLLLVDDEAPALSKLRRFLAGLDDVHVAGEASDGAAALDFVQARPEAAD